MALLAPTTLGQTGGKGRRVALQMQAAPPGTFSEEQRDAADLEMCRQVIDVLHQHYDGHFWRVEVDSHQGICKLKIPTLMDDEEWGVILLRELTPALVVDIGGRILEVLGLPRERFDVDKYQEARAAYETRKNQKALDKALRRGGMSIELAKLLNAGGSAPG